MGLTLRNVWAIVFVVVALFLLATVPVAEGSEVPAFSEVDDSTELIADAATDDAILVDSKGHQRLPESPGGVVASIEKFSKVTDHAKAVPFGGAAGLAAFGIRGPTTI